MTEQKPAEAVRSHWLSWALELMLTDRRPEDPPVTVEVQTGDQPIAVEARDGAIRTRLGRADDPDATVAGPPRPILGLLLGLLDVAEAEEAGVSYQGDRSILDRIRGSFTRIPEAS
jgi:hypothetical protein